MVPTETGEVGDRMNEGDKRNDQTGRDRKGRQLLRRGCSSVQNEGVEIQKGGFCERMTEKRKNETLNLCLK